MAISNMGIKQRKKKRATIVWEWGLILFFSSRQVKIQIFLNFVLLYSFYIPGREINMIF